MQNQDAQWQMAMANEMAALLGSLRQVNGTAMDDSLTRFA